MALKVVKTLLRFRSISNYAVKFPTCSTRIELIDVKKIASFTTSEYTKNR